MAIFPLKTAVVWVIYRRPIPTQRVFEAIREAQPPILFIAADGPEDESEHIACKATRAIVEQIDWDCDVYLDFSEANLGLQQRVVTAIDWAFQHVDEMIFLEDDTLPAPEFFQFCQAMLNHYRDEPRIMHISGNNFQPAQNNTSDSYFFSQYPHYWGWATWKRAWQYNDAAMIAWRTAEDKTVFRERLHDQRAWYFWHRRWNRVCSCAIDSYSYPWIFACLCQGGLAVEPCANLVTNIGFGSDATHTKDANDPLANYPLQPLAFPLRHPAKISVNQAADRYKVDTFFYPH